MGRKRFENKVVAITGAASGIGYVTAKMFGEEGARVIIIDKNEEAGIKAQTEIFHSVFIKTDIMQVRDIKKMVAKALRVFGRIDVLVNNAGIFKEGSILDTDEDDWHHMMETNLNAMYYCMKYVLPVMVENGEGSVVNVASEAGMTGFPNQTCYNVTKAGVIMLSRCAALDFCQKNIRVNCICPGRTMTPIVESLIHDAEDQEEMKRQLSEDRPLMRLGKPEEIAAGILYMASDESRYMIGAVLAVDGGYTAR